MIRFFAVFTLIALHALLHAQSTVSFSFDDPNTYSTPLLSPQERNAKILRTLEASGLKSTLFVCGMRVENDAGKQLVKSWDDAGHPIANHSYSHKYYHSAQYDFAWLETDFLWNDSLISRYKNYTRFFRFPYLKEGNTTEKRDSMRALMKRLHYRNGYVSIDASDWYVDQLLCDSLRKNPDADTRYFCQVYIQHILQRAAYYDSLATLLTGRKIKHVLLLHHNLLNALFLPDLIAAFKTKGWKTTHTEDAYLDPVYAQQPAVLPAGESIVYMLAQSDPRHAAGLRYPGEDGKYEERWMKYYLRTGGEKIMDRYTDPRTGIPIIFVAEADMFPESWLVPSINQKGNSASTAEVKRSLEIILRCLAKYPAGLLKKYLERIYITSDLEAYGTPMGGTRSNNRVYVNNEGINNGYTDAVVERIFHAELSSIFYLKHAAYFAGNNWTRWNDSTFTYADDAFASIRENRSSQTYDTALHKLGFLCAYGATDPENDFNSFVRLLFLPDDAFYTVTQKWPRLLAKRNYVIGFYQSLDASFTESRFRTFTPAEKDE